MSKVEILSVNESKVWICPVLLQDGKEKVGLTKESVNIENLYLLDNGIEVVVWAGKEYLCKGFGSDSEIIEKVEEDFSGLRGSGRITQRIVVVRAGGNAEKTYWVFRYFWWRLLGDKTSILGTKQGN
jgi:hypothetical protein